MAEIQFFYFPLRGKGEFIRLLLHAAGVAFDDNQVSRESFFAPNSEAKAATPYGQLPYLIYKGKKYGQSIAIGSYFARKYGFFGKTEEDGLRVMEVIQLGEDFRPTYRDWFLASDPAKKAEEAKKIKEVTLPRYLGYLEALLVDSGATGFFVGGSVSLADLVIYDMLDTALGIHADALAPFPSLQKMRQNVEAVPKIKKYLASRAMSPI